MPGITTTLIVQMIPRLSEADRARIMQALLATGTKRDGVVPQKINDSDVEFVLGCVVRAVEHMGLEFPGKEHLRRSAAYKSFAGKVPDLMKFMRAHFNTRVEMQRALSLGVVFLYRELASIGGSVQVRRILAHIHRIPAVYNKMFPGYAESKVLHLVVRRYEHA